MATMTTMHAGFDMIREAKPVSNTFHNLVQTLSVKLDSAARYGLYEEDAHSEGHEDCAQQFEAMAERERQSIRELVECIQRHVGEEPGHSIFLR